MRGMSDDELWLELHAPHSWETALPPVMHPVPVAHLPGLEPGERVTVRMPGPVWLVDELMVASGPHPEQGREVYRLTAVTEPGAGSVRPSPPGAPPGAVEVIDRAVDAADLWVYRDETAHRTVDDLDERTEHDWLDRIGDGTTPPVRRPRPSRELPLLTGQRVRVPTTSGGWAWYVAVTEPVDRDGEIVLGAVAERHYWQAVYGAPPETDKWVYWPALHTCWTY